MQSWVPLLAYELFGGKARFLEAVQSLSAADGGAQQSSAPQEEGGEEEGAARRVRADFASLLAEASAVPAAAGLVVPSWDEGGDAVLDSELNAAAAAPRGKAGGKAREGSLGATLLGDGDGGGGGDSGGLAAAAEPAATGSRPTEWGPRQVGEEFAALELPPVRCEWEGGSIEVEDILCYSFVQKGGSQASWKLSPHYLASDSVQIVQPCALRQDWEDFGLGAISRSSRLQEWLLL